MLDYRAWIVASLIALSAAGAYVIWLERPRAGYNARSLTAANHPAGAQNITQTLHVEGCEKGFIVKTGELVEPRAVPGAPIDQFRNIYGKETKRNKSGILTWELDPYSLTEGSARTDKLGNEEPGNFVGVSVNSGHVVETLDGIDLGIDSFATIYRKMRDRRIEVHERIDSSGDSRTFTVSFYSYCGHKFRSEYSRTLPASAELDNPPVPTATSPQNDVLSRAKAFMNKVVYDYSLVPSNGRDESVDASPSQHH
jgi:hypothetical protein